MKDGALRPPGYSRAIATVWIRLIGSFPNVFAIVSALFLARWGATDGSPATPTRWRVPVVSALTGVLVWSLSGWVARLLTRHQDP